MNKGRCDICVESTGWSILNRRFWESQKDYGDMLRLVLGGLVRWRKGNGSIAVAQTDWEPVTKTCSRFS